MSSHLITNKTYLPALEGWRGIVALFILLFHFYIFFAKEPFVPYGFLGVDFFFMIWGFIIAKQYETAIATRAISFKQFVIRRATRLYPMYIFSIVLFLLVNHFYIQHSELGSTSVHFGSGPETAWYVLLQLTMLSNFGGMPMPWNGPAWVVSVAWIVNLFFFAVVWQLRRFPTLLWMLIAGFCFIYLIDYSPHSLALTVAEPIIFNPTIARGLFSFAIGALIYKFHHSLPPLSNSLLHALDVMLIAAIVLLLGYYNAPFVIGVDYVFVLAVFLPLIVISLYRNSWVSRAASVAPLVFLGRISYSLYLLHVPLGYFYQYSPFIESLGMTRPVYGLVFVALCVGISTLTYLFIETPFRAIGRRMAQNQANY